MKQKITLLVFIFFMIPFSFGQGKEPNNMRYYEKSRRIGQIIKLNRSENIYGKVPLFIKTRGFFQNSKVNSSKFISSPSIIKYKLEYEILQYWDETLSQLVNHSKTYYGYDNKGNLTLYGVSHWEENQWGIGWKIDYAYDTNGNLLQEIESYWWESQWQDSSKIEYTYDTNGNLTQVIEYHWSSSQWKFDFKYEYTYNANGDIIQLLEYYWNGSQWINDINTEYTYDSKGNLIQVIEVRWSQWTNQWSNSDKNEYTYDINGNITEYIDYNWSSVASQWINNFKTVYIYDKLSKLRQIIDLDWNGSQWINYGNTEYIYDAYLNIVQGINYNWNGSQWVNDRKYNFTYNNSYAFSDLLLPEIYGNTLINIFFNHMLTNGKSYIWDTTLNDWTVTDNSDFSYSEHEILSVPESNVGQIKIYPNPVSNVLTIKSEIDIIDKVEIYSVFGKKIKTINSYFENINTEDLSNGIYLLRINSEKGTTIKKLIKK